MIKAGVFMSTGAIIKKVRKQRNMTQKLLAEKVQVSPQVISNWEREYTTPDSDDIRRLAEALDCSVDYLLGVSNNINKLDSQKDSKTNDLTPYQQEVIDFFNSREDLFFHDHPGDIRQALEQFEIYYEVWKKQQGKKK